MPYSNLTPVTFKVSAPVRYGETLYIVGDVPALGSGNYSYGVPLVTTPDSFPEWSTKHPIPLAKGQLVHYKYAIFSGGNFSRWEELQDGRLLTVTEGTQQTVVDSVQLEEHFKTPALQTRQMSFKKITRINSDSLQQSSFRERKKRLLEIDDDDGVIIVSYFLPVKITRLMGDGSESETESKETDFENKAAVQPGVDGTKHSVGDLNNIAKSNLKPQFSNDTSKSQWKIEWDETALLSRKKSSKADNMRVLYIGYPNYRGPILPGDQESLASALVRFRCVPVFLKPEVRDLHYHVYCYDTLRKLFHHQVDVYAPLPTRWWNGPMHVASWIAYRSVNQSFAEKVVEVYNEGDIIWIHGFELLLLPSLLKRRLQAGNPHIGLFIHSPFPSSEIFRTLSVRDDILRGMLNADQIGFHLYEYARPFLSCCHRILGIQHHGHENDSRGMLTVDYQGRRVFVTVCHAGIEPDLVRDKLGTPKVFSKAKSILCSALVVDPTRRALLESSDPEFRIAMEKVKDQILIIGLDAMEHLRGVHFKLISFEAFLEHHPDWADKVCLIQVYQKVDRDSEESVEVRSIARRIAKRINENFPRPAGRRPAVCLLEWNSWTFADRLALFAIADMFWNTPLRSGLDLPVFEFTVVADARKRILNAPWQINLTDLADPLTADIRADPALILSEFTAAFRVLPASLRCNPWRETEMVETLLIALTMEKEERLVRNDAALKYVNSHVESGWAGRVLSDIKRSHPVGTDKRLDGLTPAGLGFGLQFRAIEFRPNFRHLSDEVIIDAYRTSFQRLIILDYGGTTVSDEYIPHDNGNVSNTQQQQQQQQQGVKSTSNHNGSKFEFRYRPQGEAIVPHPKMIRALQTLVADPRNSVFIVSGRERQELEAAFEDIPGIGLTAEHGCFYSWGDRLSFHHVHFVGPNERSVKQESVTKEEGVYAGGLIPPSLEEPVLLPPPPQQQIAQQGITSSTGAPILGSSITTTPPLVAAPTATPFIEGNAAFRRRARSSSLGSHDNPLARRASARAMMSQQQQEQEQQNSVRDALVEGSENRKLHSDFRRGWVTLSDHFDDSWMDLSEQIMDVYTQRTNGTYIERKGSSIVWQYRDAEPEFGTLQAAELQDHLHGVLKAFPIEVVSGKGYVEVCPQGVDKGNACAHILAMLWPNESLPDFVLCIGDDIADEAMFEFFLHLYAENQNSEGVPRDRSVSIGDIPGQVGSQLQIESSILSRSTNEKANSMEKLTAPASFDTVSNSKIFTCVVGEKPSVAQYYVNDVEEVGELLSVLAKISTKLEVSRSFSDFKRVEPLSPKTMQRKSYDSYRSLSKDSENQSFPSSSFFRTAMPIAESLNEHEDDSAQDPPDSTLEGGPMDTLNSRPSTADSQRKSLNVSIIEGAQYISSSSDAETDSESIADSNSVNERQNRRNKYHQSFLDLRLLDLEKSRNLIASASMPALSEYFSLDVKQPTSTTAQQYLDLIADDNDDGIMF